MICFMNTVSVLSDLEQRLINHTHYVSMKKTKSFLLINKMLNSDSQILIKIMYTLHGVLNIGHC